MKATWATIKKELLHIWGPWEQLTRSQLRSILFDYVETFYSRQRHQARLGHRTAAEAYAPSEAAQLTTIRVQDRGSTPWRGGI